MLAQVSCFSYNRVCVMQIDVWNRFDVFQVANLSKGSPLETVTLALFSRHDLLDKLKIPFDRLQRFVRVQSSNNSQHGLHHAV